MADQLQILISTGFDIKKNDLISTLNEIQKNNKLDLGVDLTKTIKQAKDLATIENKQLHSEKIKLQNERLALQNKKLILQSEKIRLQNENIKSTQTEQVTQKLARQTEVYSKLNKLVKSQYDIETKLLTEKDSKLQQQLQKELEINRARQQIFSNSVNKEGLFNAEKESQLLTQQYKFKQKLIAKENELAETRKKSTQSLADENLQTYWNQAQKHINDYKNALKDAMETQSILGQMMGIGRSKPYYKYEQLTQQQQNAMHSTYNSAINEIQRKSHQELNKLLTEEYNIRMRIEDAKLQRYQVASDNKSEQQRVTILEQELQKQLQVNQAKKENVTSTLTDNRLVNQEKLNQLIERESQLKSELRIKQNQIASAQKISNEKAEYNLKMFQQSMNIQTDGLNRRYSYVGGASEEIEKYRQSLQNITVENGKWYQSVRQADGSMQTQTVTAQQLRMQYRQMKNEIQGNISIFDTLKQTLTKLGECFFAGNLLVKGVQQIKEAISYTNEMNKYLTNVQIITGQTASEVSELTKEYQKLGRQLGVTSQSVATVAEDFYRQGLSMSETKELIKATTQMATLAGMGMAEATENITSIKNGYNMSIEEVARAVDSLVSIDNDAATSVKELSTALARSSNTAQSVGVDFDTLAGYIGVVSSVTRKSASSIGESMKSIFTRYSDITLNTMFGGGWLEDGDSASSVEKTLKKIGITMRESETEFRSFSDVIDELSLKWKNLDGESQNAVAKAMAGTYQRENFLVLLNNLSEATKLTEEAINSAGLAQDRYAIYLESTEAKMKRLTVSVQELYSSFMNSQFIDFFIDVTSGVLNFTNALGGLPNLLMAIAGAMIIVKNQAFAIKSIKMLDSIQTFGEVLGVIGVSIKEFKSVLLDTKSIFTAFNKGLLKFNLELKTLGISANMAAVGIGVLITAFSLFKMSQAYLQRQHEEYIQTLKEGVSENEKKISSTEDLRSQYLELSKVENKTIEDNKKLKSIQEELIKTLGLKKDAIDLLNGSWEENSKVIDKATQAELKYALTKQKDVVEDEKEKYNKASKNGIYDDSYLIYDKTGFLAGFDANENKAFEDLKETLKEIYGDLLIEDNNGSIYFDKAKMSAEELNEALKQTHMLMQDYDGLDENKYKKFATAVNSTTEAYNTFSEAQEKQYEMQAKLDMFDLGKSKEDIENMTKEETEAFKKSFAEINKAQNPKYIQFFYDMVDAIQADKKAIDNLGKSSNKASSSWGAIASSFEELSSESGILETALKELSSTQTLTEETLQALAKKYPELADNMSSAGEAIGGISKLLAEQHFSEATNQIAELTSVLDDLKKGNGITAASFKKLSETFPDLLQYMGSEVDLLTALKAKMNETKEVQQKAYNEMLANTESYYTQKMLADDQWVSGVETNITKLFDDLGIAYEVDLENYKSMEQAKAEITSELISALGLDWSEYFDAIANGLSLAEFEDTLLGVDEASGYVLSPEYEEAMKKYNKVKAIYDFIKDMANSFKHTPVNLDGIKSSSSASSSQNSDRNTIKDKYNKIIAQILSSTGDVERAIELSKQKIEMATLLGNEDTVKKEEANLIKLYDTRKKLIHEQAEQLRALLKTVNDKEVRATIGDNIVKLQNSYHEVQKGLIEDRIELVKELHEITIKGLNDEIKLLNQKRLLMNQDSNEYKETYAKEYNIVLNQQLATIKAIKDLKAQGFSEEAKEIKDLKEKLKDYDATRLNVLKSIAELNKKSHLDSLKKGSDGLKKLLEMTMSMIKQRYDDEKKMIQELINKREEAVKKEIDGYKATIDAKKKMLRQEQNDRKYEQELKERQQSIADKENRLVALSKDDSDKAKAEYKKLYEELKNEKQKLEDFMYDHSIEIQENKLDEELERYEKAKNAELEAYKTQKEAELKELEKYTSKEGNIREEALALIRNKNKELYDDLMTWNKNYGDGMTETVVDSWNNGCTAMDKYNGGLYEVLETLQKISAETENISKAPLSQFVDSKKYDTATHTADEIIKNESSKQQISQQKYLHSLMVEAKKSGNKQLIAWIEAERLKWGMDKYGTIIKQYHSGGFVGGLKHNEEFAKVLKGEFVVTDKMQDNFVKNVVPKLVGVKDKSQTPTVTFNVDRFMDVANIDKNTDMESLSKKLTDNILRELTGAYKLKFGM